MSLTGKILITGGAGFLARGIYRKSRREGWNAQYTCVSRDDAKHAALQARYPEVQCVLGDVARMSVEELALLFRGYDLVIHAAASKYVDRAEKAARETAQVNIVGSMNVAQAAVLARVPRVIGISTDKAVQPVNVYGMSKAVMERIFQESGTGATWFKVCRYGNVIGSTGSVIPMWRKLLAEGKPIKVTNPLMTRYWMSVEEAVAVIVHTLNEAPEAHVVIPMPRAMSMSHIVTALTGGYEGDQSVWFGGDPRVEIVGLRPGEKMHESLMHDAESVRATFAPDYYYIAPAGTPPQVPERAEFSLSSERPEAGWILGPEMLTLIADAETV